MLAQARPMGYGGELPFLPSLPPSLFSGSQAVPCMPVCQPARWIYPVSASLLLYGALCDWFDDLWPDCPSGHSGVHLAVYLCFAVPEFPWPLSASDLQTTLLRLLSEWREWPPASSSPHASSSVRTHLCFRGVCFLLHLLGPPRLPPQLAMCSALWKERRFTLCLAGAELNWTVRLRKYDTICFLPCSGSGAWCQGISCYLSVLGPVKWAIQEMPLLTLSSIAPCTLAGLHCWAFLLFDFCSKNVLLLSNSMSSKENIYT